MMKLRINPLVAQDLKSIKDYIAEDNADKALETIWYMLQMDIVVTGRLNIF